MDDGYIVDNGVVGNMYQMFQASDLYRAKLNELESDIYQSLVIPYMEANGLTAVRIPAAEDIQDEADEEGDDESDG